MILDLSLPKDRVRLRVCDYADVNALPDDVYLWSLAKNNQNEDRAVIECATIILGSLARNAGYVKIDTLIDDGKNAYQSYKDYLHMITKDPTYSMIVPQIYFGGLSYADAQANDTNPDTIVRPTFDPTPQPFSFVF